MKISKDELIALYYQEEKTLQEIGNLRGISRERVRQIMEKFYLPRNKKRAGKVKFQTIEQYLQYIKESGRKEYRGTLVKLVVSDQSFCKECGATANLHVHHLRYPAQSKEDLEILCCSCHCVKHRKGNGVQIQLEICKKYLQGKTGLQLAKEYNISSGPIYNILHKWNIEIRPQPKRKK